MPCASGLPGENGQRCPYVANGPQTDEEAQAWDILTAAQGQIRLGPSGRPIGFDAAGLQAVMTLKRCDSAEVFELLLEAERAIVASVPDEDNERTGAQAQADG